MGNIRIYVEGGGDGQETKAQLRLGFDSFLSSVKERARSMGRKCMVIPCGPRHLAHRNFMSALNTHQDDMSILLVDSEGAVAQQPRDYLINKDGWQFTGATNDQCHLMVQLMESWFCADIEALSAYYGSGFKRNAIPKNQNIEQIEKPSVEQALRLATEHTKKGEYQKIRHGARLLETIDPAKVRARSQHCDQLFRQLEQALTTP